MSLVRRILLAQSALAAAVLLLGALALATLVLQSRYQAVSLQELQDVVAVNDITEVVGVVRGAAPLELSGSPPDRPAGVEPVAVSASLEQVAVPLADLIEVHRQRAEGFEGESEGLEELEAASAALSEARRSASSGDVGELGALLWSLDVMQGGLHRYTAEAEEEAQEAMLAARRVAWWGGGAFAAVFVSASAAGGAYAVRSLRRVRHSLEELERGAKRVAAGDFDRPIARPSEAELARVADEFNAMARHLGDLYDGLEQRVADASRELAASERLASVGYLAAGVAHEVNNPLGIIVGFCDLLLRRLPHLEIGEGERDQVDDRLSQIRDEALRCSRITERLLSLARPGGGARQRVDLDDVARDVAEIARLHPLGRDRRIELRRRLDEEPSPAVLGNVDELRQVVLNLVLNALAATPAMTGRVMVSVAADEAAGTVEVRVEDNGRGMSGDELTRAFEPFYTRRSLGAGATRGAGLGLSIARGIIEGHGGHLSAASEGAGRGAAFSLRLPLAGSEATVPADDELAAASSGATPG